MGIPPDRSAVLDRGHRPPQDADRCALRSRADRAGLGRGAAARLRVWPHFAVSDDGASVFSVTTIVTVCVLTD
jgi:hypothetical protein